MRKNARILKYYLSSLGSCFNPCLIIHQPTTNPLIRLFSEAIYEDFLNGAGFLFTIIQKNGATRYLLFLLKSNAVFNDRVKYLNNLI